MSKYIDAGMLEKDGWNIQRIRRASLTEMIYETKKPTDFPAADVEEVVRCKDCKYGDTGTDEIGRRFYKCIGRHYGGVSPTDYCSYGERKDG